MTTYTLRTGNPATTRTDAVVIGVARGANGGLEVCPGGEPVADAFGRKLAPLLASMNFSGKPGEVLRIPTGGVVKAAVLVAVGMGERDDLSLDGVRRAAGIAARSLGNAASAALALPAGDAAHVRAIAEGFHAGGYRSATLKSTPTEARLAAVAILSEVARTQDARRALSTAQTVEQLADQVRDWVNAPPNELTPAAFADTVAQLGRTRKASRVKLQVLDAAALEDLGCGGILGVGSGSDNPPCLLRLDWKPKNPVARVALVGKGITYDSGGLTIKSGGSMASMKFDMAGAAAVVAAIHAIAELEVPVSVTAFAPMAENMISGSAMRPGDVLQTYGGRTVEVTNTDAEGRLVLADALGMAVAIEPDLILEISTLTGPCVVALGDRVAGLFGDEEPIATVSAAAAATGELVWPMPIPERIAEQVRTDSQVADLLQHNWVRWGSASFAAAFLREFADGIPFAHLDIAGPAWNGGSAWGQVPSGGTGFGVRTLVETVSALAR